MGQERQSMDEIVQEYKEDVERLARYLPWLENKRGNQVGSMYEREDIKKNSLAVPTYDAQLLAFIKEAQRTKLIDKNYAYVYSSHFIRNYKDEWKWIDQAKLQDMGILKGILSRYVLKGMTKATVWTEAVEYQIFYRVIHKMKEVIDYWSGM